jgi:hypothetical protein
VYRRVPEKVIDQAVRESLKLPARVWKPVIHGRVAPPFVAESGMIRCPTLVFWGDQDGIVNRADQDDLLRRIA